jgi:hypothetical protein
VVQAEDEEFVHGSGMAFEDRLHHSACVLATAPMTDLGCIAFTQSDN